MTVLHSAPPLRTINTLLTLTTIPPNLVQMALGAQMYGPTAVCKREFWMDIGSRLYVSGLLIGPSWFSGAVALMGIRTPLISLAVRPLRAERALRFWGVF